MWRLWIVGAIFVMSAGCSGARAGSANQAAEPVTPPPLLIDGRGTTMPLEQVVTHLAFRPYLPRAQTLAYAVLPPLGDLDIDAHRGIGIEYEAGHEALLLSEWPKQRFTIAFGHGEPALKTCVPTHYSDQALAWTTPSSLVLTLQPDGTVPSTDVDREALRLIRDGACR